MTINIVPAILEDNYAEIESKIDLIKNDTERVELDICDGKFVSTKNWPFNEWQVFETIKNEKEGLPFWQEVDYSAHLMVEDPGSIIDDLILAGFSRVFIHLEIGHDKCFSLIEEWNKSVEIGIAIKLETELSEISGFFEKVNFIQLMAREHLGEQGYELNEKIFEKISRLKEMGFEGEISVDGGVDLENFEALISSGANSLVVGSAIWDSDDPIETLRELKSS